MLSVSESTVKTHVTRIYEKLEVRTRLDLLSLAIERGWAFHPSSRRAAAT
jgi:DNA-binding NarL/FixJ family response regulator